MKTCRLYATSFVSPLEFLSSEVFYELLLLLLLNIIPADVKVASLINPANLKIKEFKTDWERVYSFVVVLSTDHRNQQLHTRMNINLKSYV